MNKFFSTAFTTLFTLCILATNSVSAAEFIRLGIPQGVERSLVPEEARLGRGHRFDDAEVQLPHRLAPQLLDELGRRLQALGHDERAQPGLGQVVLVGGEDDPHPAILFSQPAKR